jgi:FrmR/RcnR family transcriptional regulator, repressor of frmRAB operon
VAHTPKEKKRLLNRAKRLRGQVNAVVRALDDEADCAETLHAIGVCRGALDSLMAEVVKGHIRFHVLDPEQDPTEEQLRAGDDLIDALKMYIK